MTKPASLYLHIPFCESKCAYCDFASFSGKSGLIRPYVDAIKKEIELSTKINVQTIFFGGGTPSLLEPEMISEIMDSIDKNFRIENGAEITMEANPASAGLKRLKEFKKAGINRLSVGVQSLCDKTLKSIGRIHTSSDAASTVNYANEAGFGNISIDLIFGIPGQSVEEVLSDLEGALRLPIQHLSIYQLALEKGTPMYNLAERGKKVMPGDETLLEMYECATERILSTGKWNHYEVSNFALSGMECRHNLAYWLGEGYLGIGSSAHSLIDGHRFSNPADPEKYIENIKRAKLCKVGEGTEDKVIDYLIMRLRLINKVLLFGDINSRYKVNFREAYQVTLNDLSRKGFLKICPDGFLLTKKGLLFLDNVLLEFTKVI